MDQSEIIEFSENPRLRLLIIEEDDVDFDRCVHHLNKAKLDASADRIRSTQHYERQLLTTSYDVVVASCDGTDWSGMPAFEELKRQGIDVPLILVTGELGEEEAIECIKNGMSDCVLKSNLARLPRAIERAMVDRRVRDERARAEAALRSSETRFRILVDSISLAVFINQGPKYLYANRAAELLTGYSREELLALNSWDLIHPESRDYVIDQGFSRLRGEGAGARYDMKILTKSGEARWLDVTLAGIEFDGKPAGISTALDITERKLYEMNLKKGVACDPLTGLPAKAHLQHALQSEIKRVQRGGRPGAVILFQFDHLERAKETIGPLAVNTALCRLANVIGTARRSADVVGRSSENEFLVILPETPPDALGSLARRMLDQFMSDESAAALRLRAGAAQFTQDAGSYDTILEAARGNLRKLAGLSEQVMVP